MNSFLRIAARATGAVALLMAGLMVGGCAPAANAAPAAAVASATPVGPEIPHCLTEDGGPKLPCIWDSAVDGNRLPAAPNNVVILYTGRPGQDPVAHRIK